MDEDHEAQDLAATSENFREIAKHAGIALNEATREAMRTAVEQRIFIPFTIDKHKEALEDVMEHFGLNDFPRLHPGRTLRWPRSFYVMTVSKWVDKSVFGDAKDEKLLLPLFVGKVEGQVQDKTIGQPSSLRTGFKILKGDILLVYKVE